MPAGRAAAKQVALNAVGGNLTVRTPSLGRHAFIVGGSVGLRMKKHEENFPVYAELLCVLFMGFCLSCGSAAPFVHFSSINRGSCVSAPQTLDQETFVAPAVVHHSGDRIRRIHQVWFGSKDPPWLWIDTWRCNYINYMSSNHATVEHFLWTEDEIEQLDPPLENLKLYELPHDGRMGYA